MTSAQHPDSVTRSRRPGEPPLLLDRYEVLGVLGQGGMGTVYKGYHPNLKRHVAIKVLRLDQLKTAALVARFLREMAAVGQMDHPHIVRAYDAGEKDGIFYLVMEFLAGKNLSQLVADHGAPAPADACELARQAAVGLDYIHQTLVHRDVKPSNLILTPAGVVKILDLGLARLHEGDLADKERTPEGCALGTFDYMAPEQASGGGATDGRTDVYSLGCTLFKLLTGRAPFSGPDYDSVARKLYAQVHTPLTALPEFGAIPERLKPVLLRMTAKDPAGRYATAADAATALAPHAAGSRPERLLATGCEPAVGPLPARLPEELSRLTGVVTETHPNMAATSTARPSTGRLRWGGVILAGATILACVLGATAWFAGAALLPGRAPVPSPADRDGPPTMAAAPESLVLRRLDDLELGTWRPLLDVHPIVVGPEADDPGAWRWDGKAERLEVTGLKPLLFLLGTTSRPNFSLQAGITQIPWTGNVGIFWGYREDAALKDAARPGEPFAHFQMVCIRHNTGQQGEDLWSVQRGTGALLYLAHGEIDVATSFPAAQVIRSSGPDSPRFGNGEKVLSIDVRHKALDQAVIGATRLDKLFSQMANDAFASEPSRGGVGVFALSHQASFRNVRFLAQSGK